MGWDGVLNSSGHLNFLIPTSPPYKARLNKPECFSERLVLVLLLVLVLPNTLTQD